MTLVVATGVHEVGQGVGGTGGRWGMARGGWGRWGRGQVWPRLGMIGEGGVLGQNSVFWDLNKHYGPKKTRLNPENTVWTVKNTFRTHKIQFETPKRHFRPQKTPFRPKNHLSGLE